MDQGKQAFLLLLLQLFCIVNIHLLDSGHIKIGLRFCDFGFVQLDHLVYSPDLPPVTVVCFKI